MSDENWNKLEKNKRSYAFSKSGILPNPPPFNNTFYHKTKTTDDQNSKLQTVDNKYRHIQRKFCDQSLYFLRKSCQNSN